MTRLAFLAGVAAGAFLATALGRWLVWWQEPETDSAWRDYERVDGV